MKKVFSKTSSFRLSFFLRLPFFFSLRHSFIFRRLGRQEGARISFLCDTRAGDRTEGKVPSLLEQQKSVFSFSSIFCKSSFFPQKFSVVFFPSSVQNHRRLEGRKHPRRGPDLGGLLRGGGSGDQRAQKPVPVAWAGTTRVVREADLSFFFIVFLVF